MSWDRLLKLQNLIKEKIAWILLQRIKDPRLGFVTITRTKLSRDKSQCVVYFSVLGGRADRTKAEHALEDARGHIQSALGKNLDTRTIPQLKFVYDESIEGAVRVTHLIEEAMAESRPTEDAETDGETEERRMEEVTDRDAPIDLDDDEDES